MYIQRNIYIPLELNGKKKEEDGKNFRRSKMWRQIHTKLFRPSFEGNEAEEREIVLKKSLGWPRAFKWCMNDFCATKIDQYKCG